MAKKEKITIEENNISGTAEDVMDLVKSASEKPVKAVGTITIKKAKIKDDLFLEVEYMEMVKDGENTIKKSSTSPVHNDMKAAFRKLDEHLCRVCEQYNSLGNPDEMNINCKGFTIGGNGDSEGVCLIGYRGFDSGKSLNLVSPFVKWEGDDYSYTGELASIIEECKYEVNLYLFEGKHAPQAQQELPFDEAEEL